MPAPAQQWKTIVRRAIAAILLVNLGLVVFFWRAAAAAPALQRSQLEKLRGTHAFLTADVGRAQRISDRLAGIDGACDDFIAKHFLKGSTGYSEVVADLTALAGKAGLTSSGVNFHQRDVRGWKLVEVEMATVVEGDYQSAVKFVNSLERSSSFYLIDDLTLTTTAAGGIKMNVRLKTYLRPGS